MALRITQSESAAAAATYFDAELTRGDYYAKEGELGGFWHGKAAAMLGLSNDDPEAFRDQFNALLNNHHPETGRTITARQREDRRPGYDFTFSTPKAVSVLYEHLQATGQEQEAGEILDAFRASVREAMGEVESNLQTRVRKGGAFHNRTTGNMAWGEFTHFQSRPVDGIADPHLHIHAFAMNLTYDDVEQRFKAGEFAQVSIDRMYYQAVAADRLATRLQGMGYAVERDGDSFTLRGVERETALKFSRRTQLIEATAERLGLESPEAIAKLGATTRRNKETGRTVEENRALSHARLTPEERHNLDTLKHRYDDGGSGKGDVAHLEYAANHWFERKSVVSEKRFFAEAIAHGFGSGIAERIKDVAESLPWLRRGEEHNGERLVTTQKVVDEEREMLRHALNGKNCGRSFADGKAYETQDARLSDEQRAAVFHVLNSTDFITGIRGAAGTGKTTAMTETVHAIEQTSGKHTLVLAPTTAAVDVLKGDGFEAFTVAKLLNDPELQQKAKQGVVYVDEAGLMGSEDMAKLLRFASDANARVILQGDTRQHTSVARGDALRFLEEKGGVAFASITAIRRQETKTYREAVQNFVYGATSTALDTLERMGAVKEVTSNSERYAAIAESYLEKQTRGQRTLIVAPTHAEIASVTGAVRTAMKERGFLQDEQQTTTLKSLGLTEAQRSEAHHYAAGQVVQFSKDAKGFKRGERATVVAVDGHKVTVTKDGKTTAPLPLEKSGAFELFTANATPLAVGDVVRVTQGGKDVQGKRLDRGAAYSVEGFSGSTVRLKGAGSATRALDTSQPLHLAHGYAVTSIASQGQTAHHVIAALGSQSFGAVLENQAYVTLSRGKFSAEIWTDDREGLRAAVSRSGERGFALDVQPEKKPEPKPQDNRAWIREPWEKVRDAVHAFKQRAHAWAATHQPQPAYAAPSPVHAPPAPSNWVERVGKPPPTSGGSFAERELARRQQRDFER